MVGLGPEASNHRVGGRIEDHDIVMDVDQRNTAFWMKHALYNFQIKKIISMKGRTLQSLFELEDNDSKYPSALFVRAKTLSPFGAFSNCTCAQFSS